MNTKQAIRDWMEANGIAIVSQFVPFSQSRHAKEQRPCFNWRVTVQVNGTHVLSTDYSAGVLAVEGAKATRASVKDLGGHNCIMRDRARRELLDWANNEGSELTELESILDDLRHNGGDYQWEGDWYPAYLIADHVFEDYAQELAEDIGAIDRDAAWPARCIDWAQAADELKQDYSSTEIQGETYWFR